MASVAYIRTREDEALAYTADVAGVDLTDPLLSSPHHKHETHDLRMAVVMAGLAEELARLRDRVAELEAELSKDGAPLEHKV
jgi:hypothetical protein